MGDRTARLALAAAVVLLGRMALALALVPPWQQPDEPLHVSVAEVWRSRITDEHRDDRGRQAEIIRSMIDARWWRHYERPLPPGPPPTTFLSTGSGPEGIGLDPESDSYSPPYYSAIGWLLSLSPHTTVEHDLYVMRAVSMLFGLGTLWVGFLASRTALHPFEASTVTSLLALHPQFVLASTSAGPDAAVNFAGAFIWWQTIDALHRSNNLASIVLMWAAALGAAAIDRLGIALIPVALMASAFVSARRLGPGRTAVVLGIAVLLIVVAVSAVPAIRQPLALSLGTQLMPSNVEDPFEFTRRFTTFLMMSWWYSLGWVRYFAPTLWVAIAGIVTIASLGGAARYLILNRDATTDIARVAALFVLVLLIAIYWVFFRFGVGAQGRHLFPVIVPTLTLMWLGLAAWIPTRFRHTAAVGLVALFAVLDASAWVVVAVSAYM